jgi:ferredoxin
VKNGTLLLEAARGLGVDVPTLCSLPGRAAEPACLVCVVKDETSGRLLPACAARAEEGMDVRTDGAEVKRARAAVLDLLAAEHAGDCESPCRRGCPLAVDIDAFIGFMNGGDPQAAMETILARNPFPALTGRLCHAPCEKVCRRKGLDAAVSIRLLEKYLGDLSADSLPARVAAGGKKAAVVGSGPAGLAAAYHLLRLGHDVTVFEKNDRAGGGFRACAAEGALSAAVLDREIEQVTALGARFAFGVEAGGNVAWEELARQHDALVIACGAMADGAAWGLKLDVTGAGIAADRETFATSRSGVFACGSTVKKLSQSVHALRQGGEAARSAHAFLLTGAAAAEHKTFDSHLAGVTEEELEIFLENASRGPRHPKTDGGFSASEASQEARRCFSCACLKRTTCAFRAAVGRYGSPHRLAPAARSPYQRVDSHPDVVFEPLKCIKCGRCVRITRERKEPLGLAFIGRGFETTVGVPFGKDLREALTFTTAECVAACPTAALAWKRGRETNADEQQMDGSGRGGF